MGERGCIFLVEEFQIVYMNIFPSKRWSLVFS